MHERLVPDWRLIASISRADNLVAVKERPAAWPARRGAIKAAA
jgi:hypothetical protein